MIADSGRRILFAVTVFWSAVLLLLIQPMLTKAILPWFGGTAGVWTSSMLFYQCVLLLGYLYAHVLTRHLPVRAQAAVHVCLLLASLLLLPLQPSAAWKPYGDADPLARILGLLFSTAGLPYFLLSATSPLVQSWYARVEQKEAPYRLFAISNLGSLAALLAYPIVVEPSLPTQLQLRSWSGGYLVFGILMMLVAARGFGSTAKPAMSETRFGTEAWLWIALAAIPSVLWLAVANHLSQDVAAVPFLWVLPLSIYLLSFVLCFDNEGWYRPRLYRWLLPLAITGLLFGIALQQYISFTAFLSLYAIELLVICLFCHGELMRRRPEPERLTGYYLAIAAGGAAGGIFVGLIAPRVFNMYLELPLGALACVVLALSVLYNMPQGRVLRVGGTAAAAVIASFFVQDNGLNQQHDFRNFYGTLQVKQSGTMDAATRSLFNGSIQHGLQFLSADRRRTATTYYGPASGAALALQSLRHPGMRVGVIGLGVGTLAAYGQKGDYFRFYEINPLVARLAMADFSFLKESAAKCEIASGDARLTLEREQPENFDLLAVDAFSGDSIPVHLLTREAFALYFHHLQPRGALAIHVTNKHLDLAPVVKAIAESYGHRALAIHNSGETDRHINYAAWVIVTKNPDLIHRLEYLSSPMRTSGPLWTDDYSDLLRILK